MKWLFSITLLLNFFTNPTIEEVRISYPSAASNEVNSRNFAAKLINVSENDDPTLKAYKGASIVMVSKFEKKLSQKINGLKEGSKWIEKAINSDPKNIEIRLIRLSIQENLPNVVNYKKNKTEDKNFILNHYKEHSGSLLAYIKNFILQSKSFSAEEKKVLR
jgi:hypothetical protein